MHECIVSRYRVVYRSGTLTQFHLQIESSHEFRDVKWNGLIDVAFMSYWSTKSNCHWPCLDYGSYDLVQSSGISNIYLFSSKFSSIYRYLCIQCILISTDSFSTDFLSTCNGRQLYSKCKKINLNIFRRSEAKI